MCFPPLTEDVAAIPLGTLSALVIDTETTGLDVSRDRVIEIGAVPVEGGRLLADDSFECLVNPGIPIPESAAAIHGIRDGDVAGQAPFPDAIAAFADYVGERPVLGYSVGFDVGILKAEHDRHRLAWNGPRSIDIAHLVRVISPELPNHSLELVASWLGVKVTGRHRALGDAMTTARVFLELLPRLRQRGITTLAQAERACRQLGAQLREEAGAGWHGPVQPEIEGGAPTAEASRVNSYTYRHRVGHLMSAPKTITVDRTVRDALGAIIAQQVSSLFVEDRSGKLVGIVTERDILRAVNAEGTEKALDRDLSVAVKDSLHSTQEREFAYRALRRMGEMAIRHLAVLDEDGRLVGVLTPGDLLNRRAKDMVSLGDKIETAETAEALGHVWAGLVAVARTLVAENIDPRNIAAIVSRELRALTRRACQLVEAEMAQAGDGPPPVPYAMLVLGSGGREESLLAMDQDNAIVFTEGDAGGQADRWLEKLARRVSEMLDSVGVAYCRGEVMASNPAWRKDLRRWRETVAQWISRSRPDDILNSDIFFDATAVHGDMALARELRSEAIDMARHSDPFLRFLSMNAGDVTSPFGLMGKIRTENGRLDLKMHGIMPIFSAARALALRHGVTAWTTPDRLRECGEIGAAPENIVDSLVEAHRILLGLILRQQLADIQVGLPLGNRVATGNLSSYDRKELRWALEQVPNVSVLLGTPAKL